MARSRSSCRSEPVGHCGGDIKETLDSEGPTVMDQVQEDPTAAIENESG